MCSLAIRTRDGARLSAPNGKATITSAPASERPRAQASPMPLAPPVTTATRPVRSRFTTGPVSVAVRSSNGIDYLDHHCPLIGFLAKYCRQTATRELTSDQRETTAIPVVALHHGS